MIITLNNCPTDSAVPFAESIAVDFCIASGHSPMSGDVKKFKDQWKGFRKGEFDYLFDAAKKPPKKFDDLKGPNGNKSPHDVLCYFAFCSLTLEFMNDPSWKEVEKAIDNLAKKEKRFREAYDMHKSRIIGGLAMVAGRVRPEELQKKFAEKLTPILKTLKR